MMKNLKRLELLLVFGLGALISSCDQATTESEIQEVEPKNDDVRLGDYEEALAKALREQKKKEPKFEVEIDLGSSGWLDTILGLEEGAPTRALKPNVLQGDVLVQLKLPSGKLFQQRSSILHVSREAKGISRVQFDAYERMSPEEVVIRVERDRSLFKALGMNMENFDTRQEAIGKWLKRPDDGRSSEQWIVHQGENMKIKLRFKQFFDRTLEAGVRYILEPMRLGETKWEKELNNER